MEIELIKGQPNGEILNPTVIKALGIGGGGSNTIDRMIEMGVKNVGFVAINTDLQALQRSTAPVKLPIGTKLTGGLGAGGVPEQGEKAAEENAEDIEALLSGVDMLFITSGMGGGTGTGAVSVVARIARKQGILTVAVVTKPFAFEGAKKMLLATEGIERLRKEVDTLIVIPNENLFKLPKMLSKKTSVKEAFLKVDDVLRQGVQGISELITEVGEINIDFADVKTIMEGKGDALMGIGLGEGENRAGDAAIRSIENPLLENIQITGAQGILVGVTGGPDFSMAEYKEVIDTITSKTHEDAHIISGLTMDPSMEDSVKVTVVATGFPEGFSAASQEKPQEVFDKDEVVSQRDWQGLQERASRESPYLLERNSPKSHLGIPTVYRDGSRDQDAFRDFGDGGYSNPPKEASHQRKKPGEGEVSEG